jgi:quercetin dioxygenase-like cupin family protein
VAQFVELGRLASFAPASGVAMRALFGENAMLNLVEMEPGSLVAAHSHPHEQLGLVLEGELILTVDGVPHRLPPGHAFQIEGGIEHSGEAGAEGCLVLDVFQPVREDYRRLAGA